MCYLCFDNRDVVMWSLTECLQRFEVLVVSMEYAFDYDSNIFMKSVPDPHQNCIDYRAFPWKPYTIIWSGSKKDDAQNGSLETVDNGFWPYLRKIRQPITVERFLYLNFNKINSWKITGDFQEISGILKNLTLFKVKFKDETKDNKR